MIFIHHHQDSEREEIPPVRIKHVARRVCEMAAPTLMAKIEQTGPNRVAKVYVSAENPQIDRVMTSPADCGPDYWEIVIEDSDL